MLDSLIVRNVSTCWVSNDTVVIRTCTTENDMVANGKRMVNISQQDSGTQVLLLLVEILRVTTSQVFSLMKLSQAIQKA